MNPICITEAQKTAYFKTFDRKRWQFLNAYTDRFKTALTKQIEPVLSELDKGISEAMSQVDIVNEKPIREAYSQLYTQVGSYYASNVFNGLKSFSGMQTKDIDDQFLVFMQSWMETEGVDLVKNVTENTKSQLRSILKDGIEKELSVEEMARTMRDSGKIAGINRARVIARTEIIRASNLGSLQGARSSNINLSKEWIATRDGRTRTEHAVVDGTIIPTDKEFNIGGESARYPADYQLSAGQSINCRCTLAYVPAEMANITPQSNIQGERVALPDTNDVKELESLIKGINSNIDVKIPSTANPQTLKEHYRAISWVNTKIGGFKSRLQYQYTAKSSNAKGGMFGYFDPNPVNSKGVTGGKFGFIAEKVKMISFNDRVRFEKRLERSVKRGWFSEGTTIESVMAHEMTHYIDMIGAAKKYGYVGAKKGGRFQIIKTPKGGESYAKFINANRPSNEIMNDAYRAFGIDIDNLDNPKLTGKIRREMADFRFNNSKIFGSYAKEDPSEFIAMAVQYEYLHPGRNKVASKIAELVFKRYREAFK